MESFISRIGGKRALRERILAEFPAEIGRYIEVFGGAGWVLFARDKHAPMEVFNDIDGELVNLYRCMQHHPNELARQLTYLLNSREQFFDAKAQLEGRGLTDIQRAARYYILVKESFGADLRTFSCKARSIPHGLESFPAISKRLERVVVENRDFAALIGTYDRPDALIYCDPPYHGTEWYYSHLFSEEDHQALADVLHRAKGKVLLSYNDDAFVRELYQGWAIIPVERANNLASKAGQSKPYRELIIKNY